MSLPDVNRRYVIIGGTMLEVTPELLEQLELPLDGYRADTPRSTFDPLSDPLNDPFPEELR